jgi:hypothetical protein
LFGTGGWAVNGVPDDAPSQYHTLAAEQPFLFDPNVPPPAIAFDELQPIATET